jgi:hypothetical protein
MYMHCPEPLKIHLYISYSQTKSLKTHGDHMSHLKTYFIHYLLQAVCLPSDVAHNTPCLTPLNDTVTVPLSELHYLIPLHY